MIVLAKSVKGAEYMYKASTAHKVSKASAEKIAAALNEKKWQLNDGEIWYMHDVAEFTNAGAYADRQSFVIRAGVLKEVRR